MSGWNNPLPIGQSYGELYGGLWRKFSPGCSEVIAHDARTREQPPHIEPPTPRGGEPRCSLQLAFSSPSSLQLAFFVTRPPHPTLLLRPHCHLGIYRCQRSQATRAAASPTASDSGHIEDGFWFSYFSVLISFSYSHIGYYLNVFVWL